MPFDGVAKPNLQMLSAALRDRHQWPPGFCWNYRSPETCAIGLGTQLYGKQAFRCMAPWVGVPFSQMFEIFYCGAGTGKRSIDVTPNDVADAIDAHLRKNQASSQCADFQMHVRAVA